MVKVRLPSNWYVSKLLADSPGTVDAFWSVLGDWEGVIVDFKKPSKQIISFQPELRGRDGALSQRVQKQTQQTKASQRASHPGAGSL